MLEGCLRHRRSGLVTADYLNLRRRDFLDRVIPSAPAAHYTPELENHRVRSRILILARERAISRSHFRVGLSERCICTVVVYGSACC